MSVFIRTATAAATAIVLLAPAAGHAEPLIRSFAVEPGGRLTVETDTGSIDIATHDAGEVVVEVEIEGPGAGRFEVDFKQNGGDVEVQGDARDGILGKRRSHVDVRYRIRVPGRFDVDLTTAGGNISVADLDGDARVDTSGGTIELARIAGEVDASTSGGGISIEYAGGNVSADTSGGSIRVEEAAGRLRADTSGGSIRIGSAAGPVDADTSGGSITVRSALAAVSASTSGGSIKVGFGGQPESRSRLSTSGGMVTVYLAQGVGFDIRARSGVGVSSDLDVEAERIEPGRLEGRVNGGGPLLELKSSGRVRIEPM